MKKYNKITPEGTRDLLFEECLVRRHVEKTLTDVFSARGFNEVVTPGLEFYDVFDPEFSGIGQEVMYKMSDKRGRLVVMRPDSTLPIARLVATRLQNLPKPIRLFYTQPIYRNNTALTGRSDETVQTGIEMLGAQGMRVDLEVIVTAVEALNRCVPNFRFELGHAGFFRALAEQLPISEDQREDIRQAIESKNYAALNTILDGLAPSRQVTAMRSLPRLFGGEEVFDRAASFCLDEKSANTLTYLHDLYRALIQFGLGDKIIVDLGLVQRNDYYTNIVFSAYVEECGDAVLLGGRYDELLKRFDTPMPAIGFAINVDAISKILLGSGKAEKVLPADVLVHGETGFEIQALQYASELVQKGLKCENSIFEERSKALEYAKICGIKRVDCIGNTMESIAIAQDGENYEAT
ncbi:ATP phosphoribosyltransferase regulatory subunit [Caproiciproducens galactitolivorans]|uniref:ATP phosphoribosyltransferase regulatory subunit n=1 Tax=Caproiciproducens galactitolivorans TaxID=642589 RepID=A0A4Z0Y948_9FIRM|nr:ATP phosphoribosyltransferase regulatory subunit [Caproiciproducens galactitolivorans]QEY34106.1 ATP phosphoribosyltransferase regulatory subunit [Caproiciproducens galactitolivorans]TGJ76478.1 ATP phosphoribosyltransferase regulatory subunit [Caproiciproducens galactitolivorans]